MNSRSTAAARILSVAVCLFASAAVWSESTILSGMFDGAEPAIAPLGNPDCARGPLGYQQTTFRVSIGGGYTDSDAFEQIRFHGGATVVRRLYEGHFDPVNPEENTKRPVGYSSNDYRLVPEVDYVLVVQRPCENAEGAWAVAFTGPGSIQSSSAVAVPSFTSGSFTPGDPVMSSDIFGITDAPFKQAGPIRVRRDGTYYFSDLLVGAQVSLQVYTAPVDPANPRLNRVAFAAYGEPLVELKAGQDYYFVTQWINGLNFPEQKYQEFAYLLAPPAPFRINSGLAGSWYNPDTPGQGFFLTVFEQTNEVFLGWFTYANGPADGAKATHRWMTAFGPFADTSATLAIDWTAGGAFDAFQPEPAHFQDGTIELEFNDCRSAQLHYRWSGDGDTVPAAAGEIPLERITGDAVALCESLYPGPGMPGPL